MIRYEEIATGHIVVYADEPARIEISVSDKDSGLLVYAYKGTGDAIDQDPYRVYDSTSVLPRCPTTPMRPDGTRHTVIGCGSTNVVGPDREGLFDCLDCGVFFSPEDRRGVTHARMDGGR